MRVLIACEYSGRVRDAFKKRGHHAVSCDLLASESPHGWHVQGDVLPLLEKQWDLLIAHPPCTYLSSSGLHWNTRRPERAALTAEAVEFARIFIDGPAAAHIPRRAVENPIGCLSTRVRKPDQIIQPWQFGHGEVKGTCLWLHGLPKLVPTDVVEGREAKVHRMPPSADRWKLRSTTFQGIADAMAEQWGGTGWMPY